MEYFKNEVQRATLKMGMIERKIQESKPIVDKPRGGTPALANAAGAQSAGGTAQRRKKSVPPETGGLNAVQPGPTKCYNCQGEGHMAKDCPQQKVERINKGK